MLWKAVDFHVYLPVCVCIEKIFTASDQIMPMEQVHIVSEEEEEECEEEENGTLITMDTTLGLDESVSHFIHIIFNTIYSRVYACTCVCVCKTCFSVRGGVDFNSKIYHLGLGCLKSPCTKGLEARF
jgi:hypothetical protein